MSKKFNYSTVTVDRVNKYVSHMIKNPNAYRVMDLLSNRDAIKKSPILNEEGMIYIEIVLDELDATTTPKENMAICKIVNHALYNMDLPDDDGECIEEALQVIGDTIAENKMGDTTDIAYTAFSDILQGFGRLDVLGDADKDVLQVCAFVGLVNAAVETSMDNMYADIAASSTKDANKENKQEKTVEEEKSSDTQQEDSDEYQDAYDKIKDLTKKYFEGIADIAGYTGNDREEFLKSVSAAAEANFTSAFNKAMNEKTSTEKTTNNSNHESKSEQTECRKDTHKEQETPEMKGFGDKKSNKKTFVKKDTVDSGNFKQTKTDKKTYQKNNIGQIVTNLSDTIFPIVVSKIDVVTKGSADIDNGYLYNMVKQSVQKLIDRMNPEEIIQDDSFYNNFLTNYIDTVSRESIRETLTHTIEVVAKGINGSNISAVTKKIQILEAALNSDLSISNWNTTSTTTQKSSTPEHKKKEFKPFSTKQTVSGNVDEKISIPNFLTR